MQGLHISTAPTVTWFNTLVCSRLLLLQRGPDLAQAVAALKVLLREEEEHHARGTHVSLEIANVLQVVHIQEDSGHRSGAKRIRCAAQHKAEVLIDRHAHDARQQQLQLPLDDGTLVLPGAPDVAPADGEEHRGGSWRMKKGRSLDMAYRNRW